MKARVIAWVVIAATAFGWAGVVTAGSLEGRWRLVEQTYGSGQSNLADEEAPLRLEFFREGERLAARVRFGDGSEGVHRWPSLLTGDESAVEIEEIVFAPGANEVYARYRSASASGEEGGLEIVEAYRVSDDGKSLTGTVTVSRIRGDRSGGSYVLHRRFVREP